MDNYNPLGGSDLSANNAQNIPISPEIKKPAPDLSTPQAPPNQ